MGKEIFDFYNFVKGNPVFKHLEVDELLFTAYDCPLKVSPLDYWVKKNYFCYVIRGGARWKTPNNEYTFGPGDAVFLKKGAHRVYEIDDGDFCALLIFMPNEFIGSVIKNEVITSQKTSNAQHSDTLIPLVLDQSLSDYFNAVLNYFSQPLPPSTSLLKVKFKELIVNIMTSNHNPTLKEYFSEVLYNRKRELKSIMEKHFMFNLKLEAYAKLCGRSLGAFNRDFVKTYKTSPGKWLKKKRLEHGKFLLETTDLNINEITCDVGFENPSHFIKAFKEQYGHPPLKFKKIAQIN